jgi:DNA-binding PadR family transcriptional regulator
MTDLSPASQLLLRELAQRDQGDGVAVKYGSRGRWYLAGQVGSKNFNTRTFPPLYDAGLATGWDESDDDGPMRITEAGRKLAAELEAQATSREAAKKARPKTSADGPAALRLLSEIAQCDEPAWIYFDSRYRRFQRLNSRDGYQATVDTWRALEKAGYIRTERVSSIGGNRVSITDAGRKRPTP